MEESIQQLLDVLKSVVLFAGPLVAYVLLFKSKQQFRSQEGYYSTPGTVCVCDLNIVRFTHLCIQHSDIMYMIVCVSIFQSRNMLHYVGWSDTEVLIYRMIHDLWTLLQEMIS
jgi:hypothetical protein